MASLSDEFSRRMGERAERGAPGSVGGAMDRYGWSARELAQRLGVSERTARRYRQQDRVPARKAGDFRREVGRASAARQRERMERRGLSRMNVEGVYRVSNSRPYRTRPGMGVRFGGGDGRVAGTEKISAASMREYFSAVDRGDAAAADRVLGDALGKAYGSGGVEFDDVEALDYGI